MAVKPEKQKQIIETFSKRRFTVNVLLYIALFCVAFIFTSRFIQDVSLTGLGNAVEVGMAMGILTGALIWALIIWRCPNCRKFIGVRIKPKVCPKCGAKLLEGGK
jgi:hypothetical protein